jgi:hypothetical protein
VLPVGDATAGPDELAELEENGGDSVETLPLDRLINV